MFALLALLAAADARAEGWFRDVASGMGVDFRHEDGRSGEKFYVETAASGGGWIDFDGDGDLDLYLVNGAATPGSKLATPPRNRLYENRGGRFHDVTDAAGVGDTGYGMGMCVGDVDADGRPDFLVTNYGPDRLYRNLGDGRFEQIAEKAGVADPGWGASCAFGDLDGDGDLDLYVTRYVDFAFDRNPWCGDRARDLRSYCRPDVFDGVTDLLWINQGDGTFTEEAVARGIVPGRDEKGFGVVLSDLDDDGDLDLYVANDGTRNRLYVNDGRGRFVDRALESGVAVSGEGAPESGMGVAIGDTDGDASLDVVVTNYSMETNTLYRNDGGLVFDDVTRAFGLAAPSWPYVGWGVELFDADNDGDLDLGVVNGHAIDNIEEFEPHIAYAEPNQLFLNEAGRFTEIRDEAWNVVLPSRGLAVADWNDDGRLDALVTNVNDRPQLLENRHEGDHRWLGLVLRGAADNPLAIGARVTLRAGERTLVREVRSGGSFLSQGDLRLHFGLGRHRGPVEIEVRWPNGRHEIHSVDALDRYMPLAATTKEAP